MAYPGAGEFLADMNWQQHQGMISMMSGAGRGGASDALAGGMLSRAGAVGQPLISGAMGLAGLDPMSLGMRAGMGAWNSGAGVLGAGLAGAGVMAGAGIVGAGAHFVGSQMYTGAQQQLGLNQGLRQNFNFMNRQGGMGFTSSQGYDIGSSIRGMTENFGPSGEVATFGELSRLATNMGRMGMSSNVRSVAEFKDKFKEMVTTLKKVATDMGSSLEEAQKFVESMRGSGIFRASDQLKMSAGTRLSAMAGGLAMSEVTGMANIGSQISRSVGGLGRQGAFAGMKTIEQIGLAQRVGALTDEDVYNATGLNGAEGRQALATSQLQQSARFLSGGRGRRFLASIADKNGQLNESSVMEYMMGGNVSTDRTMEMAHQNLEGTGRANFIRNEGRLRGAALERFGGLAQSLVYKQWLSQRGYDPTTMDDKSMLAFQRFSGMGRDEADTAIKQVNRMPEMMAEMRNAKGDMAYSDELNKYSKTVGVEGLKRRFDQARERVQGHLQQAGADIMEQGSDMVAQWFNRAMGVYEKRTVEGVDRAMRMMREGQSGAGAEIRRLTAGSSAIMGPGADRIGTLSNMKDLGGGGLSSAMRLASAAGSVDSAVATNEMNSMFRSGDNLAGFRRDFSNEFSSLSGKARADAILKFAADRDPTMRRKIAEATDENSRLRLAAGIEKAGGFGGESGIGKTLTAASLDINDTGQSGWRRALGIGTKGGETQTSINAAIGASMMGSEGDHAGMGMGDGLRTGLAATLLGPLGGLASMGKQALDYFGSHADNAAVGEFLTTETGRSRVAGIFSGKGSDFNAMQTRLAELNTKGAHGDLDRGEKAELTVIKNAQATRGLLEDLQKTGKSIDSLTDQDKKRLAQQASHTMGRDVTFEELLQGAQGIKGALDVNAQAAVRQMVERSTSDIKGMRDEMVAGGMASLRDDGSIAINADKRKALGDSSAGAAYDIAMGIAGTTYTGDTKKDAATLEGLSPQYAKLQQQVAGMSLEDKQKYARQLGGADPVGQMMATSAARQQRFDGLVKKTKGGAGSAEEVVGKLLGVDVGKELRGDLAGKNADEAASLLMAQQGVTGSMQGADSYRKSLSEAIQNARLGKSGLAADALAGAETGAQGTAVAKQLEKFRTDKMGPAEQSAKHLSTIAEGTDKMLVKLGEIATNTNKDKPPPDGPGATTPNTSVQPGGGK